MLKRIFVPLLIVLALTSPANARKMPYGQGVVSTKDMPISMMRHMALPPRQTLVLIAGAPLFKKLAAVGKNMGFCRGAFHKLKPCAAAAAISIPAEERAGQAAGRLALDQLLQQPASNRGIKVFGLESVDEQLNLLDGLPVGDQIMMLRQAVKDAGQVPQLVETMKKFYLARDLSGLFDWMRRQAAGEDPRLVQIFHDRMINVRNRLMATRMAARLRAGGAFVAVGSAHLPGRKGVLSLLARQGYRISRIY